MPKKDLIDPIEVGTDESLAQILPPAAAVPDQPAASPVVPFPQTDAERAALENELQRPPKGTEPQTPEQEAAFHTRRYFVCLALRGVTYDRGTVPIPERAEEREALDHELENPAYYAPYKPVETMTYVEQNAFYIRRRQMMFALRGEPDDTTPAAKDAVRKCCG